MMYKYILELHLLTPFQRRFLSCSSGGGDNCRGNRHPYALDEEFDSSEDEDFEMEPSEEEFYIKRGGSGGRKQTNVGSSGGESCCFRYYDV